MQTTRIQPPVTLSRARIMTQENITESTGAALKKIIHLVTCNNVEN